MKRQQPRSPLSVLAKPLALAALSIAGLLLGLTGDGWRDAASWVALAGFELETGNDPAAATAALQPALYLDPQSDEARAILLLALRAEKKSRKKGN